MLCKIEVNMLKINHLSFQKCTYFSSYVGGNQRLRDRDGMVTWNCWGIIIQTPLQSGENIIHTVIMKTELIFFLWRAENVSQHLFISFFVSILSLLQHGSVYTMADTSGAGLCEASSGLYLSPTMCIQCKKDGHLLIKPLTRVFRTEA